MNKVCALLPSKYKLEQTFPKINEVTIKEGDPNYKDKEAAAWKTANEQLIAENNGKKPNASDVKERADILLNIPVYGAVRDGDFCNDFFPFLKEKHKQLGIEEHGKLGHAALVMHSADGCKHNTGKKDVPIITCNEQLYSLEVQKKYFNC